MAFFYSRYGSKRDKTENTRWYARMQDDTAPLDRDHWGLAEKKKKSSTGRIIFQRFALKRGGGSFGFRFSVFIISETCNCAGVQPSKCFWSWTDKMGIRNIIVFKPEHGLLLSQQDSHWNTLCTSEPGFNNLLQLLQFNTSSLYKNKKIKLSQTVTHCQGSERER